MKNIRKIWLSVFAVVVLVCMMQVTTSAYTCSYSGEYVTQTDCTDTTISIKWSMPSYSTSYSLTGYKITDYNGNFIKSVSGAYNTSTTITGLQKGIVDKVKVYASYSNGYDYFIYYADVNTTPKNIASMDFVLDPDNNKFTFSVSKGAATGIRVEKTVLSTGAKYYKNITTSSDTVNANVNVPYILRARPYYKNADNGKTYFGKWTVKKYCVNPYVSGKAVSTAKGFDITLKRCKGVKYYRVYLSTTRGSNYVLSNTITVTGASKTTHISKIGSSTLSGGRYYYIKVLPVFNTSSGLVASHTPMYGNIYVYR